MNQEENRIQILFDGKPDAGIRSELKHAGFRWAPSQGAWQRMLNQNGIYAADSDSIAVSAVPNSGYSFAYFTDNGVIVSKSAYYVFCPGF